MADLYGFNFYPQNGAMSELERFRDIVRQAKMLCKLRSLTKNVPGLDNSVDSNHMQTDVFIQAIMGSVDSGKDFAGFPAMLLEYKMFIGELLQEELPNLMAVHTIIQSAVEKHALSPFGELRQPTPSVMGLTTPNNGSSKRWRSDIDTQEAESPSAAVDDSPSKQINKTPTPGTHRGKFKKSSSSPHTELGYEQHVKFERIIDEFLLGPDVQIPNFWYIAKDKDGNIRKYLKYDKRNRKLQSFSSALYRLATSPVRDALTALRQESAHFHGCSPHFMTKFKSKAERENRPSVSVSAAVTTTISEAQMAEYLDLQAQQRTRALEATQQAQAQVLKDFERLCQSSKPSPHTAPVHQLGTAPPPHGYDFLPRFPPPQPGGEKGGL